jgi:alginate O-acetyltransferase complex protein AlgI
MTLNLVLISIFISLILGMLGNVRWRLQVLLGLSAIAVFAFQPALPVRNLDFWIPTGTLSITVITWILTTPHDLRSWRTNWSTVFIIVIIVLMLGMSRYFTISLPLTASHPPQLTQIIILLAGLAGVA